MANPTLTTYWHFDPSKPLTINGYTFVPAAELSAALAHLYNARFDLQRGVPVETALATLNGGIARVEAAL